MDDLIRRSYDNLRHMYKSCFLYLGVFPEVLEIQVSKLFQLWIVEGFIPQIEKAGMEEIAEQSKAENLFHECDMGTVSSSSHRLFCINSQFANYISNQQLAQNVNILPQKIPSLLNLQTLVVHTTSPTLDIQADIWAMTKPRHLHTNTSTTVPKCLEQSPGGENLQTLSTVSPESLTKDVFKRAKNLKKLGICGKLNNLVEGNGESSLSDSLCELDSLENLKLYGDDVNSKLLTLPQAHKFPPRLSLHNTSLDWNYMSILGNLGNLDVLTLKDYAFKGDYWKTKRGGFPSLKVSSLELRI
ncbi:putative late blight resistance protein homolog R1B-14 [Coffea arabica]|uniref:Late blight resistance protein homolog R1B-14 n=1 Tax=Coffea arabica TaxID=13443 RepID=A0ABM4UFZ6_COFAR